MSIQLFTVTWEQVALALESKAEPFEFQVIVREIKADYGPRGMVLSQTKDPAELYMRVKAKFRTDNTSRNGPEFRFTCVDNWVLHIQPRENAKYGDLCICFFSGS
jgi:3-methyladenine DNA glycosylase AlkC